MFINVYEKIDCVENYNVKYYVLYCNKIYVNNNLYFTSKFITHYYNIFITYNLYLKLTL